MATAPQINDTTTLSGQPVQVQPGSQLPYTPGAAGTPPPATTASGTLAPQTAATPGSVMTAGPVTPPVGAVNSPVNVVKGALDQIAQLPVQDPNKIVQDSIASFEDRGSAFMTNAQRRGLEQAASRGLGNSSIAAGAAQRAALESITPFVNQSVDFSKQREQNQFASQQNQLNQALDLQKQREGLAFQGEQAQIDRDLKGKLQQDAVYQQDWLADRNFTRELNGLISQLPIQNAFAMQQLIAKYALENPEVYTPQVTSGLTNFFQNNMSSILKQYFPNYIKGA